jgi:cytochrome c oxidase cbb3-type subunit 3
VLLTLSLALCLAAPGCKREQRTPRPMPAAAGTVYPAEYSRPSHPGPLPPPGAGANAGAPVRLDESSSAYAVNQGEQLYNMYNCVGCHAHGGGGMGPPLMDNKWIYGAEPDTVFETIIKGRPNGMPSFAGKIPDAQVWEIVAYVRSMSGQLSSNTSPSRSEDMGLGSPENSRTREKPIKITPPPDVLPTAGTFTFPSGHPTTATAPTTTTAPGGKP